MALHDNNDSFDNPYVYIIGFEIRARDCSKLDDDYLHLRRNSPASSVHSSQPDQDSVYNADQPQPGNGHPTPTPLGMSYTPHPPAQPGYNHPTPVTTQTYFTPHLPPPHGRRSSDDWIHRRLPTPGAGSPGFAGLSPNWLMNLLPQIKIEPFNGDLRCRSSRLGQIEPDYSRCYGRIENRRLSARFGIGNDAGTYSFSSNPGTAQQLGNKGVSYDTQPSYSFRFS